MINLLKKSCRISVALLCGIAASAQEKTAFTWEASLPRVSAPGFYRIPITPALSARAFRDGGWDVRLYAGEKEVPYLATQYFEIVTSGDFKAYPTPRLESIPGKETVIIFKLETQKTINEFGLRYDNTNVPKKARLTGSPDMVQWYSVKEDFRLQPFTARPVDGKPGIVEETIVIPTSGFRYFKLVIDDSASAPLHINCVGFRSEPQQRPSRQEVPGAEMKLLPAADRRADRYLITLPGVFPVGAISLSIPRPELYHRNTELLAVENGRERLLARKTLRAGNADQDIGVERQELLDSLILRVENGDNPPLEPRQPRAWQDRWVMVAKLDTGRFVLKGGDPNKAVPSYDIQYFRDNYLAENGKDLWPGDPADVGAKPQPKEGPGFFTSRVWVWIGIVAVVGLLALVVRGMLRDMKRQKP